MSSQAWKSSTALDQLASSERVRRLPSGTWAFADRAIAIGLLAATGWLLSSALPQPAGFLVAGLILVAVLVPIVGPRLDAHRSVGARNHAQTSSGTDSFRAVLDATVDPFVIHRAVRDAGGSIVDFERTYGNQAVAALDAERGLDGDAGSLDVHPFGAGFALFAGCCQVVDTGTPMLLDEFALAGRSSAAGRLLDLRIIRVGDGIGITGRDITRYIHAERAAAVSNGRLIAAIEQTADSVVISDPQANILYVNPAFERTTGYTSAEVVGQNPRFLKSGVQEPDFYAGLWETLTGGQTWRGELVNRRKDGSRYVEDASITPVFDREGNLSSYVAVNRDITQLREIETTLSATVRHRSTVLNALATIEQQETPEATAQLICESMVQLSGVDIGAIIQFTSHHASLLGSVVPDGSPFRRGDLLPDARAAYLRERASSGPWTDSWRARAEDGDYGTQLTTTGLQGAAYAPIVDSDGMVTGLVTLGTLDPSWASGEDELLIMAREFAVSVRTLLGATLVDRSRTDRLRAGIARIIAAQAFHPVFQPVVDLHTGAAIGYEALTRFDNGRRPDLTFAEAHSVKMGLDLEAATLRKAVEASVALPGDGWLSINVSPRLILEGDRLRDLLAGCSRPIVIEITEHEPIENYEAIRTAFGALGAGLRIAVDDAGAGVANFNHIVELRPDFVKIDISLIRNVDADVVRQAAVVSLLHFARSNDRWAIAEGVETEAERATLERLGIQFVQGYLFSRPMRVDAFAAAPQEHPAA